MTYRVLLPLALFLGFAPFYPRPHLTEKLGMLLHGTLRRPVDIFDLCWHAVPVILLGFKIGRDLGVRRLGREEN